MSNIQERSERLKLSKKKQSLPVYAEFVHNLHDKRRCLVLRLAKAFLQVNFI